jgi:DNA-binding transcriptional LysR family regulator
MLDRSFPAGDGGVDRLTGMRVFATVAERASFAAAAEVLGLSRTMISKHVAALEDRLGARLLNRTTRRISLTEAGAGYLERVTEILQLVDEAEGAVSATAGEPRGLLRVNAPMSFSIHHLAPCLAEFRAAHPKVDVELTLNDRVVDLIDEGVDVAIRIGKLKDSSLIARRLATARLALCAAPSYLARRGEPKDPAELAQHDCLQYSYASDRDVWQFDGPDGRLEVRVRGPLTSNNGDALMNAAIAGLGIVRQPTFIVGEALRDGRLVRILPGYTLPVIGIHAVLPGSRHVSAKTRSFVEFLVRRFAGEPYWDR